MPSELTIYTIGHSNHTLEAFLALLARHGIAQVADVRRSPYCEYAVQFNREALQESLQQAGVQYHYLGDTLGGVRGNARHRSTDFGALYEAADESPEFREGLSEVEALAERGPVAIVCAEGDPTSCHRHWIVARALAERGARMLHILPNGSLHEPAHIEFLPRGGQLSLVD